MKINLPAFLQIFVFTMGLIFNFVASAETTDKYVVELYETYCAACHSIKETGAPIAFDAKQWSEIAEQRSEQVVNNAITGIGNMPAQGGCMECSYQDFEELVHYMSTPKTNE